MFAVGDIVRVQRSSGKAELGWIIKSILPGFSPLGIDRTVIVACEWNGQEMRKEIAYRTLEAWQTWAVCDTWESLNTPQRPSTISA